MRQTTMNSTHKPSKTGDNIHIKDFTEQVVAYIRVIYLNTDKMADMRLKYVVLKTRNDMGTTHSPVNKYQMYINTQTIGADVHQHSDSHTLIYKITTC